MAYKSTRQMCFERTMGEMANGFDKSEVSKIAASKRYMYAKKSTPKMSFCNCYLCGTHDGVKEITYGENHSNIKNTILVCEDCCKWLGEFLLSEKDKAAKEIIS